MEHEEKKKTKKSQKRGLFGSKSGVRAFFICAISDRAWGTFDPIWLKSCKLCPEGVRSHTKVKPHLEHLTKMLNISVGDVWQLAAEISAQLERLTNEIGIDKIQGILYTLENKGHCNQSI